MTGGYTMKEKNIRELAKRMGLITVEDMCQYTIAQLVVKIANKVNELVDEVWRFETDVQEMLETQNENIQYLLGEGLNLEVENIFDGWLQDGTFDTLINQTALEKVNERIDETNAQLSEVDMSLNEIYNVGVKQRYKTINEAYNQWVADGKPKAIIKIFQGEYLEYLNIGGLVDNNRLIFEGVDKNIVTWRYTNGDYDYAPFTGGGNITFKNLTIIADHPQGWTGNGGAYGLHIDHPNARGKVIIENCDIHSYQDSALGCGTSTNQEIHLKDVNLYHYAEKNVAGNNGVNHGALLYHTSATPNSTGQKIHFENVYAYSKNGPGIQLLSSAKGNVEVESTFINCVARSDFYESYDGGAHKESRVTLSNDNGMIKISDNSRNNNSSKLNSVASIASVFKTQYIRVLRDLSLLDDLIIPYWSGCEIDYIEVKGYIESKKTYCNGWYYALDGRKYLVYSDEILNNNYINSDPVTAKFIAFSQNSLSDRIFGDVKSLSNNNLTISWENRGAGMTGTAQLMFIIHYK